MTFCTPNPHFVSSCSYFHFLHFSLVLSFFIFPLSFFYFSSSCCSKYCSFLTFPYSNCLSIVFSLTCPLCSSPDRIPFWSYLSPSCSPSRWIPFWSYLASSCSSYLWIPIVPTCPTSGPLICESLFSPTNHPHAPLLSESLWSHLSSPFCSSS
jgi:hypothetical protein